MQDRTKILLEALPYIRQFHDKTIVVKIGGRVIGNEELLDTLLQDVVLLNFFGMKMVVVHGGGPEISDEMRKMGVKPRFIEGLRVTDEKTMEILHEQLAGKISTQMVLGINHHGGKIIWGDGYDFVLGEMEFDFCGMLVGAVKNDPNLEEIYDTLHEMKEKNFEIDGRRVGLRNFSPGSHFLNLYEVENCKVLDLPKVVAVLHTSANEMRDSLINFARERAEEMRTPFGKSFVLRGSDARKYEKRCKYASDFSRRKRKLLFDEIFEGEVIANHNHYELIGLNEAIIGCNLISEEGEVFVITLGGGSAAYLVKGKMNLSPEKIKEVVPSSRARTIEGWVHEGLRKANILPHGGGHKLNEVNGAAKVILYPDGKVIIPRCRSKTGSMAYVDMKEASLAYRSKGIMDRVRSLKLGDHFATLRFIYGIKVDFESR